MSSLRRFKQVDVFTCLPLRGNPLAVVLDAQGITQQDMQAMARWTNLSETTFVLPPTDPAADYRVRIFSSDAELPFAGHPTLGTAHALLESGLQPKVTGRMLQECGIGLVQIDIGPTGMLAFRAPPAQMRSVDAAQMALLRQAFASAAWQRTPVIVQMGLGWLTVQMDSAEACLAVYPDSHAFHELIDACGVSGIVLYGAHVPFGVADYEVRAFFMQQGVVTEDPVTGSANACIARVLQADLDAAPTYSVRQGTRVHRDGRVVVTFRDGAPWIGGACVTVVDGFLHL